jgi:hypothetical protein
MADDYALNGYNVMSLQRDIILLFEPSLQIEQVLYRQPGVSAQVPVGTRSARNCFPGPHQVRGLPLAHDLHQR